MIFLQYRKVSLALSFLFLLFIVHGQENQGTGSVSGQVLNKNTFAPLQGISIRLSPSGLGTVTDSAGFFRVAALTPGTFIITVSGIGFGKRTIPNVIVNSGNENTISIELEPVSGALAEVVVTGRRNSVIATSIETPLSVQRLTSEEIKRNPGGNFDISKVVQSLPGVGGGVGGGGFRNDIIIRGGAPGENVYYLDGIEIPVINHFGTQGSGGGPQGILNANFIEEVNLSSSAFDARYDNVLSGVLQFKQKTGNRTRTQGNVILSATEVAFTLDGPLSSKTTYLASVRRSYLQFLFKLIDLPIRPNYWDYQFRVVHRVNEKTTLNLVCLGAIDEFRFAVPSDATPEKLYVLNSNPLIEQWNYTFGISFRRLTGSGYYNIALSRNTFNNDVQKFEDNDSPTEETRTLNTDSRETENKLRFDQTINTNGWKFSYGASLQYVQFDNRFFNVFRKELTDSNGSVIQPSVVINSNTETDFIKYGSFLQISKRFYRDRLSISGGVRTDGNNLANSESNLLKQFSPRLSASYALNESWSLNASVGRYYKLPPYTQLAFRNGGLKNPGRYIQSTHFVAGTQFLPDNVFRITLEGFYKKYADYPVSTNEGISFANKGSEFGSIGNEPVVQTGTGRAYGLELLVQKKLTRRFFGLLSYTWYKSEFSDISGRYIPAAWDNGHLLSATLGYKLPRNWEIGIKFRYQGEAPFTPFDLAASQRNYLSLGTGILDYSLYNQHRLPAFHASDLRVDKKWNFERITLNVFIDINNWYRAVVAGTPQYTFKRSEDNKSFISTDGQPLQADGSNAIPVILDNRDIRFTPSVGFILEF